MAEQKDINGVSRDTLNLFRWALAPDMSQDDFERGFAEEFRKDRQGTMEYLADETFKAKYEGQYMPNGQPFTREAFDQLSGFQGWKDEQVGAIEGAGRSLAAGATRIAGGITRTVGEATGSETITEAGRGILEKSDELRGKQYVTWDEAKNKPLRDFPPFVIQTLIESVPEMALALGTGGYSLAGSGLVALGYAGNILEERAKNKSEAQRRTDEARAVQQGKAISAHGGGPKLDENASLEDWLYSLGGGTGVAILSKLGLEGAIRRSVMKEGIKALGAREVGKRLAKGSLSEGLTELPQEFAELGAGRAGIEGLPELTNEQLIDMGIQATTVGAAGGTVVSGGDMLLRGSGRPPAPAPSPEETAAIEAGQEVTQPTATPPPPDATTAPGPETVPPTEEEIQAATPPEGGEDISMIQPGETYAMRGEDGTPLGVVTVVGRDENTVTLQDEAGDTETVDLDDPSSYLFRFNETDEGEPATGAQPDATTAPGPEAAPEIASPVEVEQALRTPEQEAHLRYEEEIQRLASHIETNPNDQQATEDLRKLKGQSKDFLQLDVETRNMIDAIVAPDPEGDAEAETQAETEAQADAEAQQTVELENAMAGVRARIDRLNDAPTEERLTRLDQAWKEAQKLEGFKALGSTSQAIFDLEDQVDVAMAIARGKIKKAEAEGTTLTPPKAETKPDKTPKAERPVPSQVQRYEGDTPTTLRQGVDKPQGLYTSPADVESPHSDLGGEHKIFKVNPKAKTLRLTEFPSESVVIRKGTDAAGTGVHLARHFLGETRFEQIRNLSLSDLRAEGNKIDSSIDWNTYTERQDAIEGIGGVLARQAGYDAVWMQDEVDPKFDEFVALTPKALSETKAAKTEPAKPKKVRAKRPKVENNPEEDDILAAVALLGGIDREQADAQYGFKDYHGLRGKGRAGISRVFKKGGMKLDDMAELLHERGYLENRDMAELEQKLNQAIRGEKVFSKSRPIDEDVEQEMSDAEEEAEAAAQQEEADLTEAAALQQQAIEAGASMEEVENLFNTTMLGTDEMRTAFNDLIEAKQAQAQADAEAAVPETEIEGDDDLDFNPEELEPTAEPEELTEGEKLEFARGLNRLKAESARVRKSPTESNITRLESIWSEVQKLSGFKKWTANQDPRILELENDIEGLIDDAIEGRDVAAEEQTLYDTAPEIDPEITREIDVVATRVLPPGVGVDILQDIFDMSGKPAKGRYSQNLIQVAAEGTATIDTFNHETIHALRDADLFTSKEWSALVREAEVGKWLEHYGIARREAMYDEGLYQDGNPTDAAYEEAIADAYRDWVRTGELPPGPHRSTLQRVFARITEFFRDIGRYLTRQNVAINPRSVFENVASGQVGSRGYYRAYATSQAGIPVADRSVAPQLPKDVIRERKKKGEFDALGQEDLFNRTPSLFPQSESQPIPGMDELFGQQEETQTDKEKDPEVISFYKRDEILRQAMGKARRERSTETLNALAAAWQSLQFHKGGQKALGKDYDELMDVTRKEVLDVINPPTEREPATTGAQVEIVTEYLAKSPVETVNSAGEAAAASKLISRHAQESFMGIVTDKAGKVLGILKHTTGGINEANIYPSIFVGAAHQIPGAAKVWATHNHPSGTAELSIPDKKTNERMTELFDGTDIEYQGILAVPAGKQSAAFARPAKNTTESLEVPIVEGESKYDVPLFVRAFSNVPRADSAPKLQDHTALYRFAYEHFKAGGKPSLVFADSVMRPIATFALSGPEMRRLRGGRQADLLKAMAETNAVSMFYMGEKGQLNPEEFGNLVNFATKVNKPLHDAVFFDELGKRPYTALSNEGVGKLRPDHLRALENTWYSRSYDETMQENLPENLRQDEDGKTEFDKGVERNYKGINTEASAVEFFKESLIQIKNRANRTHVHLPHSAPFADLQERLRHLEAAPVAARTRITNTLRDVLDGIDAEGQMLLTKKILLDDFSWTAEQGMALPYGLTSAEDVAFEQQRLQAQLEARPDVVVRLAKRKEHLDRLRNEMLRHKVLRPEQAQNENYAHHQVVAYAKTIFAGTLAGKIRTPKWMRRKGSTLDINANYAQAEASWMQKAYQDIATKKFLNWLRRSEYNKRPEYIKRANDSNNSHLTNLFQAELKQAAEGTTLPLKLDGITSPYDLAKVAKSLKLPPKDTPLLSQYADFQQRIAMSLSYFRGALKDVDKAEIPENLHTALEKAKAGHMGSALADRGTEAEASLWDLMGWVMENPRIIPEAVKPALGAMSAISKRRAFIRQTLGDSYINPRSTAALIEAFAPTDTPMKGWQEDAYDGHTKKMTIFNAKTVPEHTVDAALEMLDAGEVGTSTEYMTVLRQMLKNMKSEKNTVRVVGAPTYEMIVDQRIAETLNDFSDPDLELGIKSMAQKLNSGFKIMALFSPQRFIKYISNDEIGDIDATVALMGKHAPGFAKEVAAAAKEISGVLRGDIRPSREFIEAIELGVIDSGRTPQEVFEHMDYATRTGATSLPGRLAQGYLRRVTTIASIRENMHRYAAYRYFRGKEMMGDRSVTGYGASKPELIDAISDPLHRAAKLARDAYGDYGGVSVLTKRMAKWPMPFVRFMATNTTRYNNYFLNAFNMAAQEGANSRLRGALVGASLLGRIFALYGMVNIGWNYLFWDEEEKELGPDVRNRLHAIIGRGSDGTIYSIRAQGTLSDYLSWVGLEDVGAMLAGRRTYSLGDFIEKTAKAPINKTVASITPYVKTPIEIFQGKAWWPDFFAPRDLRDPVSHAFRPFAIDQEVNMVRRWMGSPIPSKGVLDRLIRLAAYADHPDQIALTASRARAYKFLADNRTSNSHLYNALYLGILYSDTTSVKAAVAALEAAGVKKENIARAINRRSPISVLPRDLREAFLSGLTPFQRQQLERAERISGQISQQARRAVR